ncbi:MAG: HAD family hydrolase [Erysipelotrichia bacterium]|nr:HAD family hydrolase [Erysipelotrichia bacterium]
MNIIFDVDDTLYDQTQPFKRAFNKLWKGKYEVDLDALYRISREYSNAIFDQVLSKKISIDESGVYRIQMAMKDFGYVIDEKEALTFQLAYRHFQGDIIMSETMQKILTYCKRKQVKLGVLTNGISAHQHKKIAGLHLQQWIKKDFLFVSDDIGASKPDPKAFAILEEKMHLEKENTYYIGDSLTHDVMGAKQAGWHVIWLDRRGNDASTCAYTPYYTVKSEEELFTLLQALMESFPPVK